MKEPIFIGGVFRIGDRVKAGCGNRTSWTIEEVRKEDGWVWGSEAENAYFGMVDEKNFHNPDFLTKID